MNSDEETLDYMQDLAKRMNTLLGEICGARERRRLGMSHGDIDKMEELWKSMDLEYMDILSGFAEGAK